MATRRAPVKTPTNVKAPTETVNQKVKPGLLKASSNTTQRSSTPSIRANTTRTTTTK
ncbi:hypothetical protein CPT_Summit_033 [Stenotrophomonas phage Summit]|nr:hypothetical protein CPT_Summit_033 [Stenotrophomonas phage Summit]